MVASRTQCLALFRLWLPTPAARSSEALALTHGSRRSHKKHSSCMTPRTRSLAR